MRIFGRSFQDAWRHAGKPTGVGICSHFVHISARLLCCKQVVCIFAGSIEKRDLSLQLFLARPSEVALQHAVGSGTMTGIHVYGQKARLSNSGFIYVL